MAKIAHIVHPVLVEKSSDLYLAQPITFETMKVAKEFASDHLDIELYSVKYSDESPIIPTFLIPSTELTRSVTDVSNFKFERKLALIKDILDRLYEESEAEYFIYTNVDIALMPNFYLSVNNLIDQGYDAFIINRRTIPKFYNSVDEIPLMFAELGEIHPGLDCFVFKREVYKDYELGLGCIGTTLIGRILLVNLICNATNFKIFENLHLTFHIGDDKPWYNEKFVDYAEHNLNELNKIINHYKNNKKFKNHPIMNHFLSNNKAEYWIGLRGNYYYYIKLAIDKLTYIVKRLALLR